MFAEITNQRPTYFSIKGISKEAFIALEKKLSDQPLRKTEEVHIDRIKQAVSNELKVNQNGK